MIDSLSKHPTLSHFRGKIFNIERDEDLFKILMFRPLFIIEIIRQKMLKTPGQELRDQFMRDQASCENHNDDQYMNRLKQMGVQPHPSIFPAFFKLKNGLQYPGMAASEPIGPGEVLVKVPEQLVLSSIKALQEPHLVDVFSETFYQAEGCWEDRVLNTYCLYLCSTEDKGNIFYEMVQHMSKEIDIACFWDEKEIDSFKDQGMRTAARIDLEAFEHQWQQFQKVKVKYEMLQTPYYSKENYRWIFTHITSRCFGKSIDYTSFVPFCEFFNHHASAVYYKVNENSPSPAEEDLSDRISEVSSSGTFESDEYIEEGEFAYDEIESISYLWEGKQCYKLNQKEKKIIAEATEKLLERIETDVDWKDFTVLFAGYFIEKVKIAQNQYLKGRKNYQTTYSALSNLQKILQRYIELVEKLYKQKLGKKWERKVNNRKNLEKQQSVSKFIRPDPFQYKPSYENFMFETDKKDSFDSNSQVYFCYGRNSNRTLLLRYGFAIEGNKYDHVWVTFDLSLILGQMPDLFERVMKQGLSTRRKFRVNHTRLNLELIIFHRLNNWNLYSLRSVEEIFFVTNIESELEILSQVAGSLKHKLKVLDGDYSLQDKNLTYHEYFTNVYHIEQIRILNKQLSLLTKLKQMLRKMSKGISRKKAEQQTLTDPERYILKQYLDSVII